MTLMPMSNLAILYRRLGRYVEAEELFVETLEITLGKLGPAHSETARCRLNLGLLQQDLGRYAEAETLLVAAQESYRRALSDDHPRTLGCIQFLARLYRDQRRFDEAEMLFLEAFEGRRRVLGPGEIVTLESARELAALYVDQGRPDDARPLLEMCIAAGLEAARAEGATPDAKNECAWMLLTCELADLRDPDAALALALEANDVTGHENPGFLDTLALAHHLTGATAQAVEVQQRAISFLPPGGSDLRSELESALARFEAALAEESE